MSALAERCPSDDELAAFVESRAGATAIEAHIDGCTACRRLIGVMAQLPAPPTRRWGEPPAASEVDTLEGAGFPTLASPRGWGGDVTVALAPGALIGRYRVEAELGSGGMGVVYRATDTELHREVALKVLRSADHDEDAAEQLLREARVMARFSHPNVVTVFDTGRLGADRVFIAMELVAGSTLRGMMQSGRADLAQLLAAFRQAGEGLAAAHAAGFVHRDFKPDNVLVGRDGRVRVTDFGLARSAADGAPRAGAGGSPPEDGGAASSLSGRVAGTPAYMAPEQFLGKAPTDAVDQFSFCVALYEALTNHRPFRGGSFGDVARARVLGERAPWPDCEVSAALRALVDRGMHQDPSLRFPSMRALLDALDAAARPAEPSQSAVTAPQLPPPPTLGDTRAPEPAPSPTLGDARLAEPAPPVNAPAAPTSRRRVLAAALVALVAIGGATGAVLRVRASEPAIAATAPCLRGADVVGVVWDGAARARLHDARPKNVGTAQWGAVEAALDAQAAAWAAAYDDSCRASMARTLTGDARARRDFCLQRRLDELALQALEPKRTHRSLSGRAGLGRVDECTDDATLARLPLPADAAGRARVLDGYRALYADRLSATDTITRAAYPPLTVEDMAKGTAGGQDWLALQRAAASSGDDDLATRIDVAIVPRRRTLEGDFGDLEPAARARLQRMRRKDLAASLDAALADEALEGGDYEAARAAAARALEEVHPDHVLARTDRVAAAFALAEASLELGSADAVEAALRRLERESIRGLGGERGLERALRGRAALMRTPDTSSADLRAVLDTLSTRSEDAFERRARALAVLGLARAMAAGLDGAAADPRQAARLLRAEDERLSAEGVNLAAVLHGRIVLARVEIERPAPAAAAPDLYRACNLLGVGGSAPPDRVRCIVMLARAEAALGKQALALEHLELLVSLAPRSTPVARVEAATALLDATRRTRAASPAMLARATAFATETVAAVPPATPGLDALRAMLGKG